MRKARAPTLDTAAASWPCPSTDHGQNSGEFSKPQSYHLSTGDKNVPLTGDRMWDGLNSSQPKCRPGKCSPQPLNPLFL